MASCPGIAHTVMTLTDPYSGIGPSLELAKHGISQVVDLPVGHNFSDHPMLATYWHLDKPGLALGDVELVSKNATGRPAYHMTGWYSTGMMTFLSDRLRKMKLTASELERHLLPERAHTECFVL